MHPAPALVAGISAYDDAVPHPETDVTLAARFADLRDRRRGVDLTGVRDVVAVVSSSRGGSTMLGELLRGCDGVLSLPGEMNPYVVVAQLSGSDRGVLGAELAREVGRPAATSLDTEASALSVAWRMLAQWPGCDLDLDGVRDVVSQVGNTGSAAMLQALRRMCPDITAERYDNIAADQSGRAGAPRAPVIEMAPYVGFRPWRLASDDELARCPLVIATPRNSYRLDLLHDLFPNARLRVLHLTRNPAASVNGLIDGWLHPGFHNVEVDRRLDIAGYSDVMPGGRSWWKFDVPPEWSKFASATLAEVCALQWWSAHEAVLAHVACTGADYLQVRYEDLVGTWEARVSAATQLAHWLGLPVTETVTRIVTGVAPKMATVRPRPRRWANGHNDIAPALAQPHVWNVTARLGYDQWDERLWI